MTTKGATQPLTIAHLGGGGHFAVTLLHGLKEKSRELAATGRRIDLRLMDVDLIRANRVARYSEILLTPGELNLTVSVTDSRDKALEGADWVIFGIQPPAVPGFGDTVGRIDFKRAPMHVESALEAARTMIGLWPYLCDLARDMRRLAPGAVFATLANPTDVLAGAFEKAFGFASIGICMEVPQTQQYLASEYFDAILGCCPVEVNRDAISMDYIGGNHIGWVTKWTVNGEDGAARLARMLEAQKDTPQSNPWFDAVHEIFQATGCLRTSLAHLWPLNTHLENNESRQKRKEQFINHIVEAGLRPAAWADKMRAWDKLSHDEKIRTYFIDIDKSFDRALSDGAALPNRVEGSRIDKTYVAPDTRHTFGAIAVGLAGGQAGPVPIQARNGDANPDLAADLWLEAPTRIEAGRFVPQRVTLPPAWLFDMVSVVVHQRKRLADWFAGRDRDGLVKALLYWPEGAPLHDLLDIAAQLAAVHRGD